MDLIVKKQYLDCAVAIVKDGRTISCKLCDADKLQLEAVKEVFPEYFEKAKPEKGKPSDD